MSRLQGTLFPPFYPSQSLRGWWVSRYGTEIYALTKRRSGQTLLVHYDGLCHAQLHGTKQA